MNKNTPTTHEGIRKAVTELEQERRETMRDLMRDYDERYYSPNLQDMQDACGRMGHEMGFLYRDAKKGIVMMCHICNYQEQR